MKGINIMTAAFLTAILATSCGSSKSSLQPEALNGEWNIITVNGQQATADKQPYIGMNLQEQRLYGCAGCNRLIGSVIVENNKAGQITFGKVGSTRMLCPDMQTESAVLEALSKVTGYKGTEKAITLIDKKGKELLELSKRPEATLTSLNGRWNIISIYGETPESIEKTEETPFIEFDAQQKKIYGNSGCNIVNGEVLQTKDNPTSLQFDRLISTMKAGLGMTVEGKVLEAIDNIRYFIMKDDTHVALMDENGKEALTLEKQP